MSDAELARWHYVAALLFGAVIAAACCTGQLDWSVFIGLGGVGIGGVGIHSTLKGTGNGTSDQA